MVFTRSQFNKEPHKYETRLQTNREEMKKEYAETMKLLFKVHDTIKENNNIIEKVIIYEINQRILRFLFNIL